MSSPAGLRGHDAQEPDPRDELLEQSRCSLSSVTPALAQAARASNLASRSATGRPTRDVHEIAVRLEHRRAVPRRGRHRDGALASGERWSRRRRTCSSRGRFVPRRLHFGRRVARCARMGDRRSPPAQRARRRRDFGSRGGEDGGRSKPTGAFGGPRVTALVGVTFALAAVVSSVARARRPKLRRGARASCPASVCARAPGRETRRRVEDRDAPAAGCDDRETGAFCPRRGAGARRRARDAVPRSREGACWSSGTPSRGTSTRLCLARRARRRRARAEQSEKHATGRTRRARRRRTFRWAPFAPTSRRR